jgi:peptidoglycan/LPS O-acetylase OafA/YrhL
LLEQSTLGRGDEDAFNLDNLHDIDNGQTALRKSVSTALQSAFACIRCLAQLLRPSFLSNDFPLDGGKNKRNDNDCRAPPSRTTALDGLRGYAAFAVMNYHVLYAYRTEVFYGYGLSPSAAIGCARPEDVHTTNRWFHQLPVVRLLYTGTWPVSVFFVISGVVLSCRPLLLQGSANGKSSDGFAKGAAATASALLRRSFRLYGPPLVATFVTMLVIQAGGYEHGRVIAADQTWLSVIQETHHQRFGSFGLQFRDWARETWRMFHVFWWGDFHNRYDVHLWTVPAEFRCSLALFLILPARPRVRKILLAFVVVYVYGLDRWDVALFYTGLLIADTFASSPGPASSVLPRGSVPLLARCRKLASARLTQATKAALLLLSLLLLSAPDFCIAQTPGYRLLGRLIPPSDPAPFRFLPNIGAILLVFLIVHTQPQSPLVSWLLNSSVPQYLGRISYSLYIVHGPLIHTAGYALFPFFWMVSGRDETWRYVSGFVIAYLALACVTVYVADRFWVLVDIPFVRLAKACRGHLVIESEQ